MPLKTDHCDTTRLSFSAGPSALSWLSKSAPALRRSYGGVHDEPSARSHYSFPNLPVLESPDRCDPVLPLNLSIISEYPSLRSSVFLFLYKTTVETFLNYYNPLFITLAVKFLQELYGTLALYFLAKQTLAWGAPVLSPVLG